MNKQTKTISFIAAIALLALAGTAMFTPAKKPKPTMKPTQTSTQTATATKTSTTVPNTPSQTITPISLTATETSTASPSFTPTLVPSATNTPGNIAPFPGAPLCPDHGDEHETTKFHKLWDFARGCHYDNEHGQNPFTSAVAAAFPGFDLLSLLCGNEISHCNPSSLMENVHKHGGNKWQVDLAAPKGCALGFEDGTVAVDAYAVQYHNFGRQDVEFEVRQHSSVAMLRQCKSGDPADKGYVFVGQLQEYGQRITPYQGFVLPYPDSFQPTWATERGQYFSTECVGNDIPMPPGMSDLGTTIANCRDVGDVTSNNIGIWTSKITGQGARPPGSSLFTLLFRPRDSYQRILSSDLVHPFTWEFICGGATYNPAGCRFNNSSTTIHEIAGTIPASWDNLAGWDTDPRVGRITAEGFVTRFGNRNTACTVAVGLDCQPIKLVSAFVGRYSSELSVAKVSNPTPQNTPERDVYFCAGVPCTETSPGAVPSGWIGSEN